jgi:hypothetical protein
MKITYDPEVDVLCILFSNASIEESDENKPGVILDYDKDGTASDWRFWMLPSGWGILGRSNTLSQADDYAESATSANVAWVRMTENRALEYSVARRAQIRPLGGVA